jgi:hypothetical protein
MIACGQWTLSVPPIDPVRIVRFHCPHQGDDPSHKRPAKEEVQKKMDSIFRLLRARAMIEGRK